MRRGTRADLWQPFGLTAASMNRDSFESLTVWARLEPGVSREAAEAHLAGLLANLGHGQPRSVSLTSLGKDSALEGESREGIRFTTGLSVFVLSSQASIWRDFNWPGWPPGATSKPSASRSGPAASA